jgi:hypothetical protein
MAVVVYHDASSVGKCREIRNRSLGPSKKNDKLPKKRAKV